MDNYSMAIPCNFSFSWSICIRHVMCLFNTCCLHNSWAYFNIHFVCV